MLPLSVGDARVADVARVMDACLDARTLLLVSTDLSHYLPQAQARRVDADTVEQVVNLGFMVDTQRACGAVPLAGLVELARRRGWTPRVLDVRTSGDTAGGPERVVGYAAMAMEPAP